MNKVFEALLTQLSYGEMKYKSDDPASFDFVETLAQVYERARSALEYRAENLVRRAAIERILKRWAIINPDPKVLTKHLLTELKWAKYLTFDELKSAKAIHLEEILQKYISFFKGDVPQEWILKIASAEIEETLNFDTDYNQFTFFAFQIIKQKINLKDENTELLTFFAVDKVYAASDDEKIAYHIVKLAGTPLTKEKLEEAWRLFNLAKSHKALSRINKFVRRQMPPLILLRDIYFYQPERFKEVFTSKEVFEKKAEEVLDVQLRQLSGKISTAGVRSVIYVFLTKMIIGIGVEVPFEIIILGHLNKLPLVLNMIFPPLLMWLTTMQIRLPSKKEEEDLIARSWFILERFDSLNQEEDALREIDEEQKESIGYYIFSVIYWLLFIGVFAGIIYLLRLIGYSLFSEAVFLFFLTIIAFFAYRISQIVTIYSWKGTGRAKSSLVDIISLPILTIGSRLSVGLSKLNFLGFVFDFILEAPFKLILGFVDDWVQFLSVKKEEQILE